MSTLALKLNHTSDEERRFLNLVKEAYNRITGHESYGDTTEYFDEDGIVMMTTRESEDGKINFSFSNGDDFEYESKNGFDLPEDEM